MNQPNSGLRLAEVEDNGDHDEAEGEEEEDVEDEEEGEEEQEEQEEEEEEDKEDYISSFVISLLNIYATTIAELQLQLA